MYRKTITALTVALIGWASAVVTSPQSTISAGEWITFATALATALGVYQIANLPERRVDGERGGVEAGSLALGLLVGLVLGFLFWAGGR